MQVQVITIDARIIHGKLIGSDLTTNIILTQATERIFNSKGMESIQLGVYLIRGDSMYPRLTRLTIGEVDIPKDATTKWNSLEFKEIHKMAY